MKDSPSWIAIAVLAVMSVAALIGDAFKKAKMVHVATMILMIFALLIVPAIAGQTNFSYQGEFQSTVSVPQVMQAPPMVGYAIPSAVCYQQVPLQLNTLALLPTQASYLTTGFTAVDVDGPTRREVRVAERKGRKAARAQAKLQTTVTTTNVGVVQTGVATAGVGIVGTPTTVATPQVHCEGVEAH